MNHFAFADDLLLAGNTAADFQTMFNDIVGARWKWGMAFRDENIKLWGTHNRVSARVGGHLIHPIASMKLLGASIDGDRNTATTHHITEDWAKFWSVKMALCSRTLTLS